MVSAKAATVKAGSAKVAATLDVGFMDADLGDATGTYWDIEALLRFTPVSYLELFAGYRLATMEAAGVAGDRDFYADIELSGFLLGGGLTF